MPVVSDYQTNTWWSWADFGLNMIVFVLLLITAVVLLTWFIFRYRRVRRTKGFMRWWVRFGAPLSVIPGFQRAIDKPLMQPALDVLDYMPEMSDELQYYLQMWNDYQADMVSYPSSHPIRPTYELYLQYRAWKSQTGNQSLTLVGYVDEFYQRGYDRRLHHMSQITNLASDGAGGSPSQASFTSTPAPAPAPLQSGTPFAASPVAAYPAFSPQAAVAQYFAEQQQQHPQ